MKRIFFAIILVMGITCSSCDKQLLDYIFYSNTTPQWYNPYYSNRYVITNQGMNGYHQYYGWYNNQLYVNAYQQSLYYPWYYYNYDPIRSRIHDRGYAVVGWGNGYLFLYNE